MEAKLRDLLVGAGMGHIIMPHKQFVKEHKNLLGVLKRGKRSELDAEYADQAKELYKELRGGFNAEWKREVSDRLIELMFSEGWGLEEVKQWLIGKFDFDPDKVEDVIKNHLPEVWALLPEPEEPAEPPAKRHKAGSKASSGFIRRMLGEVKKVHKGAYRPIKKLAKDSTMNSPRVFNYSRIPQPSNWLQTKFGKKRE